jgi:hypothetical protein
VGRSHRVAVAMISTPPHRRTRQLGFPTTLLFHNAVCATVIIHSSPSDALIDQRFSNALAAGIRHWTLPSSRIWSRSLTILRSIGRRNGIVVGFSDSTYIEIITASGIDLPRHASISLHHFLSWFLFLFSILFATKRRFRHIMINIYNTLGSRLLFDLTHLLRDLPTRAFISNTRPFTRRRSFNKPCSKLDAGKCLPHCA